ncbi:MAG TPA: SCO family protein [Woeseiaceae bacterium]|nr:SCO family protein [Woeseiaceae bacterium]
MHPKNLIAAVVLGVALAAGIVLALVTAGNSAAPRAATVLPSPVSLPEFRLVDDDGRETGPEVFRGQWNLVFFGFTHCPDICPLTLEKLARVRERLARAGADPLPQIVLVSVDPERDTPERLSAYVDSFGPGTLGLTGEIDEIRRLTEALGVWFEKSGAGVSGSDPASYGVDHSAVVIVIGPDARYRAVFSAPHEIEDFVHDLPLLPAA